MYADIDEFRSRLGQAIFNEIYEITDNSDEAELSIVLSDLASSAAEIDGALAFRYKFPITGDKTLALLKDWNLTLAEERAYSRPAGGEFTEKLKLRTAQVRQYLEMIREDRFILPDAAEKSSSSSAGGGKIALVQCDSPIFDRDKMEGF